ncbi:hypothetical protein DRW41_07115 [Neobacillus piezotolerans]|uniref:Uncharacterized protein n=1 Tax=Neobacillus piezotolerans TaxID=2259171 RepID=A0A3D8GT07_9BACI|nr:hypothetical protein DRW41_07115 [Neobacillus piezotolerans]
MIIINGQYLSMTRLVFLLWGRCEEVVKILFFWENWPTNKVREWSFKGRIFKDEVNVSEAEADKPFAKQFGSPSFQNSGFKIRKRTLFLLSFSPFA